MTRRSRRSKKNNSFAYSRRMIRQEQGSEFPCCSTTAFLEYFQRIYSIGVLNLYSLQRPLTSHVTLFGKPMLSIQNGGVWCVDQAVNQLRNWPLRLVYLGWRLAEIHQSVCGLSIPNNCICGYSNEFNWRYRQSGAAYSACGLSLAREAVQ